jgi:hypothetical protein
MADNNATPQITLAGKIVAGILLVCFTIFSITVLIAFWPDRMPEPTDKCALYQYSWFDMRLDTGACNGQAMAAMQHIHLNTILLIMVAAAGFLGNMIHIATSFTTYIGSGAFRKSWILWYWVSPFTASALALALYFAFGATNNPSSVDLDRTLTIAILAGLFTDIATQKLKEVFEVIFNPKDNRPDKLTDPTFMIAKDETEPETLVKGTDNTIVIHGKQLTAEKLVITMEDTARQHHRQPDQLYLHHYRCG